MWFSFFYTNEKNKLFKRGCEYRISQIHFHIGWSLVLSQNERTYCCRSNKGFPPTSPKKWFTKKSFLFLSKTIKKENNSCHSQFRVPYRADKILFRAWVFNVFPADTQMPCAWVFGKRIKGWPFVVGGGMAWHSTVVLRSKNCWLARTAISSTKSPLDVLSWCAGNACMSVFGLLVRSWLENRTETKAIMIREFCFGEF